MSFIPHGAVVKLKAHQTAITNLGVSAFIKYHLQKRFGRSKEFRLTSKGLKYPVLVRRESSDIWVFHQIFIEREYGCIDGIKDATLVIDCGANVGHSSAYFLSRYPNCNLIAVEPDPDNFSILERNLAPYGPRAQAVKAAVWPCNQALHFTTAPTIGSEWARRVETTSSGPGVISTVSINTLLKMAPFNRVSVLKIDIEGAEVSLFENDVEWLDRVDNIVIELHGDVAKRNFLNAMKNRAFDIETCGELTCCLGRKDRALHANQRLV